MLMATDRYAMQMIARGPTLARDRDTPNGSVHIVDLPDPAAAGAFGFDEPTTGSSAGVRHEPRTPQIVLSARAG